MRLKTLGEASLASKRSRHAWGEFAWSWSTTAMGSMASCLQAVWRAAIRDGCRKEKAKRAIIDNILEYIIKIWLRFTETTTITTINDLSSASTASHPPSSLTVSSSTSAPTTAILPSPSPSLSPPESSPASTSTVPSSTPPGATALPSGPRPRRTTSPPISLPLLPMSSGHSRSRPPVTELSSPTIPSFAVLTGQRTRFQRTRQAMM